MDLSEVQMAAAERYLASNPKTCPKCGATKWKILGFPSYAADIVMDHQEGQQYGPASTVDVACESCKHEDEIDCAEANIPED